MGRPRKTTTQRGYDGHHKKLRKHYAIIVAAGQATCWRCNQPILADEEWDLGHDDNDRTQYRGPEHARRCNRAAAGRKAQARRAAAKRNTAHSRDW